MIESFPYTDEESAVIDGLIAIYFPRMSGDKLKQDYLTVHEHLQNGRVSIADLRRIKSMIELSDMCSSGHREDQREMVGILVKTHAMLRKADA